MTALHHHIPMIAIVSVERVFGGAERSLLALATGLSGSGIVNCELVCPACCEWDDELCLHGVTARTFFLWRDRSCGRILYRIAFLCRSLWLVLAIFRLARELRPNVLHANGLGAALVCILAGSALRIPCIWHMRDFPRHPMLVKLACEYCAAIICPTAFILQSVSEFSGPNSPKLHLVCNPVVPLTGIAPTSMPISPAGGTVKFLMIAQIVPWKRVDLYIAAAAVLRLRYPHARFYHIGKDLSGRNSRYAAYLSGQVRQMGLQEVFTFLGSISNAQSVLDNFDALVLPSEREPFGRVVVEAWLAGKPVIVSDCGGPAELVTHGINGLVFESGNASELAASMEKLIQYASLREQLGAAGRAKACEFSVDNHTRAVCEVYERLLA
jgi:glycosyltransferase involved in cell wall biosynthesis